MPEKKTWVAVVTATKGNTLSTHIYFFFMGEQSEAKSEAIRLTSRNCPDHHYQCDLTELNIPDSVLIALAKERGFLPQGD
jgi:hypothetical protein